MDDDLFDFGFTAVNEDELESVKEQGYLTSENEVLSSNLAECQDRLDKLYKSIVPLLTNLKENPEKDYILWPNRLDKVSQFEQHIKKIYDGEV